MATPFSTVFESSSITSISSGAGADVVYTVPANYDAEITLLACSNGDTINSISVQVYHADGNEYHHLLRSHSVPANDTFNAITSNRMFLHAGDKVVAYKVGGTFDVSVSGKQYFNPVRG